MSNLGQTEPVDTNGGNGSGDNDDFLARERALLGDDANQFATPNDRTTSATVEDAEDDLLGGGDDYQQSANQGDAGFESSFPALESQNEVRALPYSV